MGWGGDRGGGGGIGGGPEREDEFDVLPEPVFDAVLWWRAVLWDAVLFVAVVSAVALLSVLLISQRREGAKGGREERQMSHAEARRFFWVRVVV